MKGNWNKFSTDLFLGISQIFALKDHVRLRKMSDSIAYGLLRDMPIALRIRIQKHYVYVRSYNMHQAVCVLN